MPKRVFNTIYAFIMTLVLSLASLIAPLATNASAQFSYGNGTVENPYKISNCDQLQAVSDNLEAHYELIVNIDCGSRNFAHIGDADHPFTGSLEGNNHIIRDARVNDLGLFGKILGSSEENRAEINNIKLINVDVIGADNVGSLAGIISNTHISNVHSNSSVRISSGPYAGGLVGIVGAGSFLEKSSYRGTITGSGVIGGLVGTTSSSTYVVNNYAIATINIETEPGSSVGGFVGVNYSSNANYNYAVSTIDASDAGFNTYVGGFVGVAGGGNISSNFAVMDYSDGADNVGDFIGLAAGPSIGSDRYKDNGHGCASNSADPGFGSCTGINTTSNPDYFWLKGNTPLSQLDFENIWQEEESDYPKLRNESGFSEVSDDINGDTINDTYQATVIGVPDSDGYLTTIELNQDTNCTLDPAGLWVDAASLKADPYFSKQVPNMTAFTVYCPTIGAQVQVTLIYPELIDTANSVIRFYNPENQTYHTVSGATFGTREVNGNVVTTATYMLVDGGENDTDGVADGVIYDPVGLAIDNSPTESGSSSQGSGSGGLASTGQSSSLLLLTGILLTLTSLLAIVVYISKHTSGRQI